ncbi:MAG TPA: GNAT family N-acetyltransferase [archaeon]|nr:GNAT family N-acetyltransferase [archaeon]
MIRFKIDTMQPGDWEQVRSIYLEGISTGNATFEKDVPAWEKWDSGHLKECRLVARAGGRVIGWAALSPVSNRCVYAGVAEASIYVGAAYRRDGVGRALLEALIESSEQAGIWTLQAGIFPENLSSLALVSRYGFRQVGIREKLGQMNGAWRDVVLLERRSRVAGTD